MADLYSLTAPTIARKEVARVVREASAKWKTRQVTAAREQVAANLQINSFLHQPKLLHAHSRPVTALPLAD
jgi:hypothetical protein